MVQWWEQGWCSGGTTHLPAMWPGFDSRSRHHMWVEFVVGSIITLRGFSLGTPVFPSLQKTNTDRFQFDLERTDTR